MGSILSTIGDIAGGILGGDPEAGDQIEGEFGGDDEDVGDIVANSAGQNVTNNIGIPSGFSTGAAALGAGANALTGFLGANAQTNAANQANQTQNAMFNATQNNLAPYRETGAAANAALATETGLNTNDPLDSALLKAPTMTESQLQSTPGYQFNLTQGLKSAQNSAAARGLGSSGAAIKGAETYATGLADNTYQNQYNNAVTNQTNQYNRLTGLANSGQSAANMTSTLGTQTAANIGQNTIGAGNAQAAALTGAGNAATSAANSYNNYNFANQLMQGIYGTGS